MSNAGVAELRGRALTPGQVLRHNHDFRRVIVASAVSDMGTWMQLMTVATLVATETGSALRSGLVAVATFSPQILTAPLGGAMADRYDRRSLLRWILAAQTAAAVALALTVAVGAGPTTLTLLVAIQGLLTSMANPVVGALIPDLVPSDSLLAASSLSSVSWNAGRIAGPAAATILIRTVGPAYCIAANAISFAVLFVAFSSLRRNFPPAAHDGEASIRTRMVTGWRAMRSVPTVQFAVEFSCANQVFMAPLIGLVPILATRRLHGDAGTVSLLYIALGVGSLAGSWSLARLVTAFGRSRVAAVLNLSATMLFLLCAQMTSVRVVAALFVPMGVCFIGGFVSVHSIAPRDAPDTERGRILSILAAGIGLTYSIGILWIGTVADRVSIHAGLTAAALIALTLMVLSLAFQPARWRALGEGDRTRIQH